MAVTIRDIAQHLNVSVSTVSRALNGYEDVASKTRQRVVDAAAELDYYPSAAARDLRRRRTDRIGFSFSYLTTYVGEFASRLINGVVAAAETTSYKVMLYPLAENELDKLMQICRTREVEGLLLMGSEELELAMALLKKEKLPFVVLNRHVADPDVSYVTGDDVGGGLLATRHLIELGHTRIAYMGRFGLQSTVDRLAGYKQALKEANLPFDEELVAFSPIVKGGLYQPMQEMLRLANSPTAVFAIHDPAAIECLQAITDFGLRVPQDVALVGFDNLRDFYAINPFLTTLHPPLEEIGRQATEILLQRIADNTQPATQVILPVELVVRQSTVVN